MIHGHLFMIGVVGVADMVSDSFASVHVFGCGGDGRDRMMKGTRWEGERYEGVGSESSGCRW